MNLFHSHKNEHPVRETLFGDMPLDQWPSDPKLATWSPWNFFADARRHLAAGDTAAAIASWYDVLNQADVEPRHHLQAWHYLRQHGEPPPKDIARQVLGTVVEVGMPKGLDLLAAYSDHTARYFNFSGAGTVWEHPDESLDPLIDELLRASAEVVTQIGLWEKPRLPAPVQGNVRLSFLTPGGLYFGEAPIKTFWNDPMGGSVFRPATALLEALSARSGK